MLEKKFSQATAIIAADKTTSNSIYIFGKTIVGIITPSVMAGTTFSFLVSIDGAIYSLFYNPYGNLVKVTFAVSSHIGIDSVDFESINYVKLVSNRMEDAERSIELILRTL